MSFFDDILNKGKEILWISKPKEVDIAAQAASNAAVNIVKQQDPAAGSAVDVALWSASRFQEAPQATFQIDIPNANLWFGWTENVNIPQANVGVEVPKVFTPADIDFNIWEPIKEIDEVRTVDNLQSIAEAENAKNVFQQWLKEVAAGAVVGWSLWWLWGAAYWAWIGLVNFWINKTTWYWLDDIVDPLDNKLDALKDYSANISAEWDREWNLWKTVWWAAGSFLADTLASPIHPIDKYFDVTNRSEEELIQERININTNFSDEKIKELEASWQYEKAANMRQIKNQFDTEISAAEIVKGLFVTAMPTIGTVPFFLWTAIAGWIEGVVENDFTKDYASLNKWARRSVIQEWDAVLDIDWNKVSVWWWQYISTDFEQKFFEDNWYTNEQKNNYFSSDIIIANQEEIAKIRSDLEFSRNFKAQTYLKFLDEAATPEARVAMQKELNEYIDADTQFYADVLWKVVKNNMSFEKARSEVLKTFDYDKAQYAEEWWKKIWLLAYLNSKTTQGLFDSVGTYYKDVTSKLYDKWFDTLTESVIKGESRFAIRAAANAERNAIDWLWALAVEFWVGKALEKIGGSPVVLDKTEALLWKLVTENFRKSFWSVMTKVEEKLWPAWVKAIQWFFREWWEEVATNPYYQMVDASKSATPFSTFDVISSVLSDFTVGWAIGWITSSPVVNRNNDLIKGWWNTDNITFEAKVVDEWFKTIVNSAINTVISKDLIDEARWVWNTTLMSQLWKDYIANGGDINDMTEEHFNIDAIKQRKIELTKTPWVLWPKSIEEQQLSIAESIKTWKEQEVRDAIAKASAQYSYMKQVPNGTKTWWDELNLQWNETKSEIDAIIQDKFPNTPNKVKDILYEWTEDVANVIKNINQKIPSSETEYKEVKINQTLSKLIDDIDFTQKSRQPTKRPWDKDWSDTWFYIDWVKELHANLLTKPTTFTDVYEGKKELEAIKLFKQWLRSPDGKITIWGKTYFVKYRTPYDSTEWQTATGSWQVITSKWISKNVVRWYIYEDVNADFDVAWNAEDSVVYPRKYANNISFWRITENFADFPWLTATNEFKITDLDGNILFTKDLKDAVAIPKDLQEWGVNNYNSVSEFNNKFLELTNWVISAEWLQSIRNALADVTEWDKQLSSFFLIQLAKDINRWNRLILNYINNRDQLIDYISAKLIQDPSSVNRFLNTLSADTREQFIKFKDDFKTTQEERFYDPSYYSIIWQVIPWLTQSTVRQAVAKSYDLATRKLIKEEIFNKLQDKIDVARPNLSIEAKAKLANTLWWVYNFIVNPVINWSTIDGKWYLGTKEDFIASIDNMMNIDIDNWDVIKQFVSKEKVFVNAMSKSSYAIDQYLFGKSKFNAEYAMEIWHIAQRMWKIKEYDVKWFTWIKSAWASSAYIDAPMDLFKRKVEEWSMSIDEWKEEILNTFHVNYRIQDEAFVEQFIEKAIYLNSLDQTTDIRKFIELASDMIIHNNNLKDIAIHKDALSNSLTKVFNFPHIKQYFTLQWIDFNGLSLTQERELMKKLYQLTKMDLSISSFNNGVDIIENKGDSKAERLYKKISQMVLASIDWEWIRDGESEIEYYLRKNKRTPLDFLKDAFNLSTPTVAEINILSSIFKDSDIEAASLTRVAQLLYSWRVNEAKKIISPSIVDKINNQLIQYRTKSYNKYYAENNVAMSLWFIPWDTLLYSREWNEDNLEWLSSAKNRSVAWYEHTIKLPFKAFPRSDKQKITWRHVILTNRLWTSVNKWYAHAPYWTNFYVENWDLYLTSSSKETLETILWTMYQWYEDSADKPEWLLKQINNEYELLQNQFPESKVMWDDVLDMYRRAYLSSKWMWLWQDVIVVAESELTEDRPSITKSPDTRKKLVLFANSVFNVNWSLDDKDYQALANENITKAEFISMRSDWFANVQRRFWNLVEQATWKKLWLSVWSDLDWFAHALIEAWVNASNNGNVIQTITSVMLERTDLNKTIDDVEQNLNSNTPDFSTEDMRRANRLWQAINRLNNKSNIFSWYLNNLSVRDYDRSIKYNSSLFKNVIWWGVEDWSAVKEEYWDVAELFKQLTERPDINRFVSEETDEDWKPVEKYTIEKSFNDQWFAWVRWNIEQAISLIWIYNTYIDNQSIQYEFKPWQHRMLTPIANWIKSWNLSAAMNPEINIWVKKFDSDRLYAYAQWTIDKLETLEWIEDYDSLNKILSSIASLDNSLKNISSSNYKNTILNYIKKVSSYPASYGFDNALNYIEWKPFLVPALRTIDINYQLKLDVVPENAKTWDNKWWIKIWKWKSAKRYQTFEYNDWVLNAVAWWDKVLSFSTTDQLEWKTLWQWLWSNWLKIYDMQAWDKIDLNKNKKFKKFFESNVNLISATNRTYSKESFTWVLPTLEYSTKNNFYSYVNKLINDVKWLIWVNKKKLWSINLLDDPINDISFDYSALWQSTEPTITELESLHSNMKQAFIKINDSEYINNNLDKKLVWIINAILKKKKDLTLESLTNTINNSENLWRAKWKDIKRHYDYATNRFAEWEKFRSLKDLVAIYKSIWDKLNKEQDNQLVTRIDARVLENENLINETIVKSRSDAIEEFIAGRKKIKSQINSLTWQENKKVRDQLRRELAFYDQQAIELWIGIKYNTLWWDTEDANNIFDKLLDAQSNPYLIEWTPEEVLDAMLNYANSLVSKPIREWIWIGNRPSLSWEESFNNDIAMKQLDKQLASVIIWVTNGKDQQVYAKTRDLRQEDIYLLNLSDSLRSIKNDIHRIQNGISKLESNTRKSIGEKDILEYKDSISSLNEELSTKLKDLRWIKNVIQKTSYDNIRNRFYFSKWYSAPLSLKWPTKNVNLFKNAKELILKQELEDKRFFKEKAFVEVSANDIYKSWAKWNILEQEKILYRMKSEADKVSNDISELTEAMRSDKESTDLVKYAFKQIKSILWKPTIEEFVAADTESKSKDLDTWIVLYIDDLNITEC